MGGLFDNLGKKLEDRDQEGGISPLDLASLAPPLRRIMRIMLREVEMTYPELCEALEKLPEGQQMSREDLDEALENLRSQSWLIRLGQDELITYKVNLRRKRGSSLGGGIWDALDSRLKQNKESREEQPGDAEGEENAD